uniref:Epidermal differentiation protein n=1 Tax=Apteryx owenii TaxID=8824 RepID=A0A8B9QY51_APTOW
MCSRGDRGCHSTESSSCHSGGSSCHDNERSSCHGSEEVICHEVRPVPDVTPVVVLPPQCPVVTQVPVAPAPCQQQQQIKQPVQWPPQQQK